jgi:hypothetical protein
MTTQQTLLLYLKLFGNGFLDNTMIVFTHWGHTENDLKARLRKNMDELTKTESINKTIKDFVEKYKY